jgi:transglutaminase-like putative cysteine protease
MLADLEQQVSYRGAPQTVAVIKKAAIDAQTRPEVRMLAEEVCRYLPSKDTVSEALAIYNLVLDRTRYMRDPRTVELVKAPWVIVRQMMAGHVPSVDCDDQSALICALLAITGAECRVVTVAFRDMFYEGRRQFSHVFAQAREPRTGAWITLDPVAGDKTREMQRRVVAAKFWPVA